MMNLDQVMDNFTSQDSELGKRVRQAQEYRRLAAAGEITADEYESLVRDLQRLEDIQLSAAELDQKIAFNEIMQALRNIPLP
jgi:cell division FtsZ-interacting protein ZapD